MADELDAYRGWGNKYVDDNIQEIQNLYKNEEQRRESNKGGVVEDEEVILIKLYEVSGSVLSTTKLSFIDNEVDNLIKYIKFIQSPMQMRLFWLSPHYQLLQSRGEQDSDFWKEVTMALVDNKHNTETSRNGYPITIF